MESTANSNYMSDSKIKVLKEKNSNSNINTINSINNKAKIIINEEPHKDSERKVKFLNTRITIASPLKKRILFKDPLVEFISIESYKLQNALLYYSDVYSRAEIKKDRKENFSLCKCKKCIIF